MQTKSNAPSAIVTGTSANSPRTPNEEWIRRQTASDEDRKEYEIERLVLWASDLIARAMEEQNLSKAEIAAKLGVSRAYVTQVLNGRRNMTLRTLGELAWACKNRVVINAEPLREGSFVSQPISLVRKERPRIIARFSDHDANAVPRTVATLAG